jgi:ubiquitin-activating enzyme E1
MEHAKQSLAVLKEKDAMLEEMDADIIKNIARFSRNAISPLAAFFGGIVAQEIVKMTGKYTPIQ